MIDNSIGNITLGRNEQKHDISTKIISGVYSKEEAKEQLKAIYSEVPAIYKPFGETVADIMRTLGLTKKWAGEIRPDIAKAEALTGLNREIFRKTMYKNNCVVDMSLVISICIGFQLSNAYTHTLLNAAGLSFRLDNPEHLAYLFLLEHCKGMTIKECNEVLTKFDMPRSRQLGSHSRGPNGEPGTYDRK